MVPKFVWLLRKPGLFVSYVLRYICFLSCHNIISNDVYFCRYYLNVIFVEVYWRWNQVSFPPMVIILQWSLLGNGSPVACTLDFISPLLLYRSFVWPSHLVDACPSVYWRRKCAFVCLSLSLSLSLSHQVALTGHFCLGLVLHVLGVFSFFFLEKVNMKNIFVVYRVENYSMLLVNVRTSFGARHSCGSSCHSIQTFY